MCNQLEESDNILGSNPTNDTDIPVTLVELVENPESLMNVDIEIIDVPTDLGSASIPIDPAVHMSSIIAENQIFFQNTDDSISKESTIDVSTTGLQGI